MDTFECYCRNKLAMTTINKAAATVLRQAQQPCDSPTPPHLGKYVLRQTYTKRAGFPFCFQNRPYIRIN